VIRAMCHAALGLLHMIAAAHGTLLLHLDDVNPADRRCSRAARCSAGGMTACDRKRKDTLVQRLNLSSVGIDTTEGGTVKAWPYTHTGGLLQFDGWSMPTQKLAWSRLDTFEICASCVAGRSVLHVCAWAAPPACRAPVGTAACVPCLCKLCCRVVSPALAA
jgi:hypothetical protein